MAQEVVEERETSATCDASGVSWAGASCASETFVDSFAVFLYA